MGWNISPETIVEQYVMSKIPDDKGRLLPDIDGMGLVSRMFAVPDDGMSFAGNGMRYRRDIRGVLPIEIEKVFLQRKAAKKAEFAADKVATAAFNLLSARHEHGNGVSGTKTLTKYFEPTEEQLNALCDADLKELVVLARKEEKMQNVNQMARKVLINSLYGACGNQHFRYFDLRNAEAITMSGQLAIKWIMRKMNEFMNDKCGSTGVDYVVYGDTDSIYVNFEPFVALMAAKKGVKIEDIEPIRWVDFLDKYAKQVVEPYIDVSYRELADYTQMYEHKMFMDREIIADRAFWTAKKRYAANVWDSEGKRKYDEHGNVVPKLKIMGIETQRSSTPPFASKGLEKAIKLILTKDETALQEHVAEVKRQYPTQDYRQLASVSSANNIAKNHKNFVPVSGCPGHIKATLVFNRVASKVGVDPIQEGEKIQQVMLKEPNRLHAGVLAFPSGSDIPPEFGIDVNNTLDYMGMFEKNFLKPLDNICGAIGWESEKQAKLDDLFGDW